MLPFIIKRGINALLTIWVIVTFTFILMHWVPGGPFTRERPVPPAIMENLNRHYHLDEPVFQQYIRYLGDLLQGDLGPSMVSESRDVNMKLRDGMPVTIQLGLQALIVAIIGGLFLGIITALNHNKWPDHSGSMIAVLGAAIPSFVLGPLLIQIFAMNLKWLPIATWVTWQHMIMPTFALALLPMAQITRMMRSSMLDVLGQDYIKTARAKGLSRFMVVMRHTIRNSMLPIVTIAGPIIAHLLTGSFVVEKIFAIPGAGKLAVESIGNRDYPMILGTTIIYGVLFVVLSFFTDIIYSWLDPRMKLTKKGER
jgi:ABC-type dipeptide/oligopeptide/nickel transport system permease component